MDVQDIYLRPIRNDEIKRYNELMQAHHYLGSLNPIGETLRYIALWNDQWVALLTFTSAALKCAVRDQWIGWRYRNQFDRLSLVTNNSRFLILPDWHIPNLASRTLSLCQKRLQADWLDTFWPPAVTTGNLCRSADASRERCIKPPTGSCLGQPRAIAARRMPIRQTAHQNLYSSTRCNATRASFYPNHYSILTTKLEPQDSC